MTTATRPWLGLIGWAESELPPDATLSAVTMATDWVSPTRSMTREMATPCRLKSLARQQASISVCSHTGRPTCSLTVLKADRKYSCHELDLKAGTQLYILTILLLSLPLIMVYCCCLIHIKNTLYTSKQWVDIPLKTMITVYLL